MQWYALATIQDTIVYITLGLLGTALLAILTLVVTSAVSRIPLRTSNQLLRDALADYKESAILTAKQKAELNQIVVDQDAKLRQYTTQIQRLEATVASVVAENFDLKKRVAELERSEKELQTRLAAP